MERPGTEVKGGDLPEGGQTGMCVHLLDGGQTVTSGQGPRAERIVHPGGGLPVCSGQGLRLEGSVHPAGV